MLHFVGEGVYPMMETLELVTRVISEQPRPTPLLIDLSRSESHATRSPGEVAHSGRHFGALRHRIERVALVTAPDVAFGLGRQASAYAQLEGVPVRVFVEREEALAWLRER